MKYRTFEFADRIHEFLGPRKHDLETDIREISRLLESENPSMISRIGSVEFQALFLIRYFPLSFPLLSRSKRNMRMNAGFFPVSMRTLKQFYLLYKEDCKDIDLFVRWRIEELFFSNWFNHKKYVHKSTLDSFFSQQHPWTYSLKGKKILVVHPFSETIESQYKNKKKILVTFF